MGACARLIFSLVHASLGHQGRAKIRRAAPLAPAQLPRSRAALSLWIVVALLVVGGGQAEALEPVRLASVRLERPVIGLYERCELTVQLEGDVLNPYDPDELTLEATFQPARGRPVTVYGFYYQPFEQVTTSRGGQAIQPAGDPVWKVRFTPTRTGRWVYHVRVLHRGREIEGPSGAVEVSPSARSGFLRLDRATGSLRFDRGETFVPIGENLAWAPSAQLLDSYDRWFEELSRQRANYIRVWLAPWSLRLETKETGVGRYDQARAWQLDQLLERSEKAGLYWQLCLLNHGSFSRTHDPDWQNNPYSHELGGMCRLPNEFVTDPRAKAMFRRLLQYLASRWGYSPQLASWEMFNEGDAADFRSEDFLPWLGEMSRFLRLIDVNRRPITVSFQRERGDEAWKLPTIDTIQVHLYDQRDFAETFTGPAIPEMKALFRKPVMVGEFGWIGEFIRDVDQDGIHLHDGLWSSLVGGSLGSAMSWWWDNYIHPKQLDRHYRPLTRFWRGEQLNEPLNRIPMVVSDADVLGCASGTSSHTYLWVKNRTHNVDQYLAYRCELAKRRLEAERGQPAPAIAPSYPPRVVSGATLTLAGLKSNGRYRLEWWDTYRGRVLRTDVVMADRGRVVLRVPDLAFDVAGKLVRLHWWEHG
ncbi:MAG: DUF5060 domain-containing protein [Candidatus Omnitrophica bacterium]|nr:DUF5060 domain-containing protein [Candidatus Omnitrophota bacterium]